MTIIGKCEQATVCEVHTCETASHHTQDMTVISSCDQKWATPRRQWNRLPRPPFDSEGDLKSASAHDAGSISQRSSARSHLTSSPLLARVVEFFYVGIFVLQSEWASLHRPWNRPPRTPVHPEGDPKGASCLMSDRPNLITL